MTNHDDELHVRGRSQYVDDVPAPAGTLHAAVVGSKVAHGHVRRLDPAAALAMPGVVGILTASDIPGRNQIGTVIEDEPLLASDAVHCFAQPLALVVADTPGQARAAVRQVRADIEELPAVFDPRIAFAQGSLIAPPRTFACGDVETAWARCDVIVEGRADTGGQEHLYIETHGALVIPLEHGGVKVFSSTQAPTAVQRIVARVLGLPMQQVEVEAPRLGGGFGGKEDQANAWAALAALAAVRYRRPVKLVLSRHEDMQMTGKRHPYSSDFKLGLSRDGRMLAYQAMFYQNAGSSADLSTAILERTLFHCTGSYFIPNVRATAASCRTNLTSNTAFRGFGGPQGMFVLEAAIYRAAERLGIPAAQIQARNLLQEGDAFPYGMKAARPKARDCWDACARSAESDAWELRVQEFNRTHTLHKQGLARMPVCFGISFTTTFLNQAAALVHVYSDGSVGVSSGAVEMGQGVNAKLREVAARTLGIDAARVRVEPTNTTRVANTSPTAASAGADLNGNAVRLACGQIAERLRAVAARLLQAEPAAGVEVRDDRVWRGGAPSDVTWESLVRAAYLQRVSLSAQAHYATPHLSYDRGTEKGSPFAYHVYGTAIVEATVDVLRGTAHISAVRLVHDAGASLVPLIDRGQIEGALVQGIGWMTIEELVHGANGRLLTDSLTTYKVPDLYSAPDVIDVKFLDRADNPVGLYHSKAIGEPPFMYGIGAFFAIAEALKAARPGVQVPLRAPLTSERILRTLVPDMTGEA